MKSHWRNPSSVLFKSSLSIHMNSEAAADMFMKARLQNNAEKNKCDLRKRELEQERQRNMAVITKIMKDIRGDLRDIQASTGYSEEARGYYPAQRAAALESAQNSEEMTKDLGTGEFKPWSRSEPNIPKHGVRQMCNTNPAAVKEAYVASGQQVCIVSTNAAGGNVENMLTGQLKAGTAAGFAAHSGRNALGDDRRDAHSLCSSHFSSTSDVTVGENEPYLDFCDAGHKNKTPDTEHPVKSLHGDNWLSKTQKDGIKGLPNERPRHFVATAWGPCVPEGDGAQVNRDPANKICNVEKETSTQDTNLACHRAPNNGEDGESLNILGHSNQQRHFQTPEPPPPSMQRPRLQPTVLPGKENLMRANEKSSYQSTRFLIPVRHGNISNENDKACFSTSEEASSGYRSPQRSWSAPMATMGKSVRIKSAPGLFCVTLNDVQPTRDVFRKRRSPASAPARHHRPVFPRPSAAAASSTCKIKVSLSKTEKSKALEQLLSKCNTPVDRTVLEKARQRLLHDKIMAFLDSFEQQYRNNSCIL